MLVITDDPNLCLQVERLHINSLAYDSCEFTRKFAHPVVPHSSNFSCSENFGKKFRLTRMLIFVIHVKNFVVSPQLKYAKYAFLLVHSCIYTKYSVSRTPHTLRSPRRRSPANCWREKRYRDLVNIFKRCKFCHISST